MRKIIVITLLLSLAHWILPGKAATEENTFKVILKDGFYGGLVGALAGGAVLAFKDDPEDHLDFISKGAAIGVIGGVTFGLYQGTRSTVELEKETVTVTLPAPLIYVDSGSSIANGVGLRINLFTWRY